MVKQVYGRDTVTGECGWFTPVKEDEKYLAGFDITGDTVTLTMADGSTLNGIINHPPFPADVRLTFGSFDQGTGILTLQTSDGAQIPVYIGQHTIDTNTDTFVTIVDNGNGTVTGINTDGSSVTWDKNDTIGIDTDTWMTISDNGDGTATALNTDGTTVILSTLDTDTFVTVVDNGDGTYTATNVNGSAITWDTNSPSQVVDTFATLSGTVITFSGGATWDIATAQENLERQLSGEIHLIDDAGNNSGIIPLDETVVDLSGAVQNTDHGLSAGQLALVIGSGGVANPLTLDSLEAQLKSIAPRSVASALYNSAAHGIVNNLVGVRNFDGSLGYYQKSGTANAADFTAKATEWLSKYNGGKLVVSLADGESVNIPAPNYAGEIFRVKFESASGSEFENYQMTSDVFMSGVLRDPDMDWKANSAANAYVNVRPGEEYLFVSRPDNASWDVAAYNKNQFSGPRWLELESGEAIAYRGTNISIAPGTFLTVPLPVQFANSNYQVTVSLAGNSNSANWANMIAAGADLGPVVADNGQNTVNSVTLYNFGTAPAVANFIITRATLDYAAL